MSNPPQQAPNPYQQAAALQFKALLTNINEADFWKTANAFDTMIDFLELDSTSANAVAEKVANHYNSFNLDDQWYDDFGWWVVATHRAVGMSFFSNVDKAKFEGIRNECWARFTNKAPKVGELPDFKNYQPVVPGGVWNSGIRDPDEFMGIQNTVTNALYWIAAQCMGDKAEAKNEYIFLIEWLNMQPAELSLWWNVAQGSPPPTLVRERVSQWVNPSLNTEEKKERDPKFQAKGVWTGDQGLIIRGILDYLALNKPDTNTQEGLMARVKQILAGVQILLVDDKFALLNWNEDKGYDKNDYQWPPPVGALWNDYSTGKGVFWRNALYAWNNGGLELQDVMEGKNFQLILTSSAVDAMKGLGFNSSIPNLTNDVAVLVAAAKMVQPKKPAAL
jgi:hypothetical protein